MIQHIPCKQTLVCHVAVKRNLCFSYTAVLLYCINTVTTRVVCRPFKLIYSCDHHDSLHTLFVVKSSNRHSQYLCDVCTYMLKIYLGNGHNNQCSYCMFKVYAYCHHCSTVHVVPNRLGSTIMCLSNSSLSNTSHHSSAHHHPTAVNNESTIFQADNKMHGNDDNSISNVVDSDSNCLHDTSDSNESFSFLNGTSTHGDSKVFFNGVNGHKFYYNSSQEKIGFIPNMTDDIPFPPQF